MYKRSALPVNLKKSCYKVISLKAFSNSKLFAFSIAMDKSVSQIHKYKYLNFESMPEPQLLNSKVSARQVVKLMLYGNQKENKGTL